MLKDTQVYKGSDQKLDVYPHCIAEHAFLKTLTHVQ